MTFVSFLLAGLTLACGGGSSSGSGTGSKQWTVQTAGAMAHVRDMHTATLLPDGKVLVIGGETQGTTVGNAIASAELFDPSTETFQPAGALVNKRLGHEAVLLPSGKVLVVGGWDLVDGNSIPGALPVEEWDPSTRSFQVLGPLIHDHTGGQAFLRQDGKVQVVGGFDANLQLDPASLITEIFDPATGLSTPDFPLAELEQNATLVPIDATHFMLLGGENGVPAWHQLNSAFLYATDGSLPNPSLGGGMPAGFARNSAVKLPTGTVVSGGGYNQFTGIGKTISLVDPISGSSIRSATMFKQRMGHQTILFPDGKVGFIAGETFTGLEDTTYLSDIEVFDPGTMQSSMLLAKLHTTRTRHTVTRLLDGSYLIAGGYHYDPRYTYLWASLSSCERLVLK